VCRHVDIAGYDNDTGARCAVQAPLSLRCGLGPELATAAGRERCAHAALAMEAVAKMS
jgi:hypothetical protein